jgi:protease IV
MKKGKYILIIFLILGILALAAFLSYLLTSFGRPSVHVPSKAYLDIDISGEIVEMAQDDLFTLLFSGRKPLALHDLRMNIRKAKSDPRIQTMVLRLNVLLCDWAKTDEIRRLILDFRSSGKKVYAYIEEAPDFDKEYYLATACDTIVLHPMGWLGINGLGGYIPFFGKTLEKIGAKAEFEHVEEYKTAINTFTESRFTPSHREMMESLFTDVFETYVSTVAEAREKTGEEMRALIDRAFFQGPKAMEAGLVDAVLFEDELRDKLKDGDQELSRIRFDDYAKVRPPSGGLRSGRKVALIYAVGPILTGESMSQVMGGTTTSAWIRQARQDKSLAAIVVRVDSPGGSTTGSDIIHRELALAAREKPVVVSMSDMAGSGGYWISLPAHKIIAHPQTWTGSIGVLAGKFSFGGLYEKIGVTGEKLTYGEKADIFTTFREFTPEERAVLKDEILWTYEQFLDRVAVARNMSRDEVDALGRGRVWTGRQAVESGLVDALGGLTEAVDQAKVLAGIDPDEAVRLVVWPKKRSFWDAFLGRRDPASEALLPRHIRQVLPVLKLMERTRSWVIMPGWVSAP